MFSPFSASAFSRSFADFLDVFYFFLLFWFSFDKKRKIQLISTKDLFLFLIIIVHVWKIFGKCLSFINNVRGGLEESFKDYSLKAALGWVCSWLKSAAFCGQSEGLFLRFLFTFTCSSSSSHTFVSGRVSCLCLTAPLSWGGFRSGAALSVFLWFVSCLHCFWWGAGRMSPPPPSVSGGCNHSFESA